MRVGLALSSMLMFPMMLAVFLATTHLLGDELGYFAGMAVYWVCCLAFAYLALGNVHRFKEMFRGSTRGLKKLSWALLACLPLPAVVVVQFPPYLDAVTPGLVFLVGASALANGFAEEIYWRGTFLIEYADNPAMGIGYATFAFSLWHLALYFGTSLEFGGLALMLLGAVAMGCLWSVCARALGSVTIPIAAHVLVNFCAFLGFYAENGFLRTA